MTLEEAFAEHRRYLFGLCYRMTAVAADAEDLVQETFVRALQSPPADLQRDLRPWLTKVATRLSIDALRRRQSAPYKGTWLPAVVESESEGPIAVEPTVYGAQTTAGRYELLESVSMAFLVALEALTPAQRAVLLLRDVFDYSVQETADALDLSEANVKTTLHRARGAMAAYDQASRPPRSTLSEETRDALGRLVMAIGSQNHEMLAQVLDDEIVSYSDGGGEFFAARDPIVGHKKVMHFYETLWRKRGTETSAVAVRDLNGLPGLVIRRLDPYAGEAPLYTISCDVNRAGRITAIFSVLATPKLAWVTPA